MTKSKASLIKQAFGISGLPVEYENGEIAVRWFEHIELSPEEQQTVAKFVSAMARLSEERKYVTPKPVVTDNPRYNFRIFLNALGFIGPENKAFRKTMLKNLEGESAFRHPKPKTQLTATGTATA